jgi:hypothetical protein
MSDHIKSSFELYEPYAYESYSGMIVIGEYLMTSGEIIWSGGAA